MKNEKYEFPIYSDTELKELNQLLEKKYNGGKKVENITQWLIDEGALNKYEAVIYSEYPCKYAILQDKLEQANRVQGRKEYAEKKNLENLEIINGKFNDNDQ